MWLIWSGKTWDLVNCCDLGDQTNNIWASAQYILQKLHVCQAKIQIKLCINAGWSESCCPPEHIGFLATHRMPWTTNKCDWYAIECPRRLTFFVGCTCNFIENVVLRLLCNGLWWCNNSDRFHKWSVSCDWSQNQCSWIDYLLFWSCNLRFVIIHDWSFWLVTLACDLTANKCGWYLSMCGLSDNS